MKTCFVRFSFHLIIGHDSMRMIDICEFSQPIKRTAALNAAMSNPMLYFPAWEAAPVYATAVVELLESGWGEYP